MGDKEFITLEEAAKMLGYTRLTLRKKCCLKELPYYRPAGRIYFEKNELKAWIAGHRVASSSEVSASAANYSQQK